MKLFPIVIISYEHDKQNKNAMINKTGLHRILYMGTGLVVVVILILGLVVIPSVIRDTSPRAAPETAVPGILFVIIIHSVIVAALVRTILDIRRGGRVSKGLHIGLGVLLLFQCLLTPCLTLLPVY